MFLRFCEVALVEGRLFGSCIKLIDVRECWIIYDFGYFWIAEAHEGRLADFSVSHR